MSELIGTNSELQENIDKSAVSTRIDLNHRNLNDEDMHMVVGAAIISKCCLSLWLCDNKLTSAGARILADQMRSNHVLQELFLDGNQILDSGVRHLSFILNDTSLVSLSLSENHLTDESIEYLSETLKTNRTLKRLWLYHNEIGDQGMKSLAHTLTQYNTTLEWVDLRSNKLVTDLSVDALLLMLERNHSLKKFWMEYCSLTYECKAKLRAMGKSKMNFDMGA